MTAVTKQQAASDDIDLVVLAERAIVFTRKNKWVFMIAIILGLALGYTAYNLLPNVYSSRLLAQSFMLSNPNNIQIVQNWNGLLQKKEYTELATRLGCPETVLYKVKKIGAEELQKVFTPDNPHGFVVKVTVTDNSILDELEKAIVYGFEHEPYIKDRLDIKRANLDELIAKTSIETQKLDSTKQAIENIIEGRNKTSSSIIIEGAAINQQMIAMNERLLSYKEQLKFNRAIQVLHSFNKYKQPSDPKLLSWLVIGLLLSLPLAFLLALYRLIKQKIKMRARSSQ